MFNINLNDIIKVMIPKRKRKPARLAWYAVLSIGLKSVHQSLVEYRGFIQNDLKYRFQTAYMEKLLSDYYNHNGFKIVNIQADKRVYFGTLHNGYRQVLPVNIGSIAYYDSLYDFIVQVTATVIFNENEMRGLIDRHCFSGKNYNIVII